MIPPASPEAALLDATWRTSTYRTLALVALAVGVASGPLALWQALSGYGASYVLVLAALSALIGVVTTERLGRPSWRLRRGLTFRLGEVVLLLVAARVSAWVFDAGWPTAGQAAAWLRDPLSFMDGPFLFAALTLLASWLTASSVVGDFLDLALQPDEIVAQQPHGFGAHFTDWRVARPIARSAIMGRFVRRWIWGGAALVIMAALARVDVQTGAGGLLRVGLRDLGLPRVALGGLIAYFFAGLLLVSEARLAVLRALWFNQQVSVTPPVLHRWRSSSLLLVGLVALIALALPLGASGWLASAILWVVALVTRLGMWLYFALTVLLMLLLSPLRWLFRRDPAAALPEARPAPVIPTQAEVTSRLPDWLGGALLWGVVALVAGYLLWNFLQANGLLAGWSARWARLWQYLAGRRPRLGALRDRLARLRMRARPRPTLRPSGSGLRLRALSSKDRVRYFYLVTVRRAAEWGLVRPPHKTPQEFLGDLVAGWPEAERDVQALTEAFVAARYTAEDVEDTRLHAVHDIWRRVMRALRRPT